MKPIDGNRRPWIATSVIIIAIVWIIGYFLTGTLAGAATVAGIFIFVGLMGLLYT